MLSMNDPRLIFIDSLMGYMETRNWAFKKIKVCPLGSELRDIRIYHYLYFSSLVSRVELVCGYLRPFGEDAIFLHRVRRTGKGDYKYAVEFRHALVHRGLVPGVSGCVEGSVLKVRCPSKLYDAQGKDYTCNFRYTIELAEYCNGVINPAFFEVVDRHGFLDPEHHRVGKDEMIEAVRNNTTMPEWAKAMAQRAISEMDLDRFDMDLAANRVSQLKSLLGRQ